MTRALLKRRPMLHWCIEHIGHTRYPLYGTRKQDMLVDCFIQWWHVSKCNLVTIKLHKFSNRLLQVAIKIPCALKVPYNATQKCTKLCQSIDEATINSLQTAAHISFVLHPLIPLLPVTFSTSVCAFEFRMTEFWKSRCVCVGGCRGSRAWEERRLDLIRTD